MANSDELIHLINSVFYFCDNILQSLGHICVFQDTNFYYKNNSNFSGKKYYLDFNFDNIIQNN